MNVARLRQIALKMAMLGSLVAVLSACVTTGPASKLGEKDPEKAVKLRTQLAQNIFARMSWTKPSESLIKPWKPILVLWKPI